MKAVRSYFSGGHRIRLLLGALFALVVSDGLISKFLVSQRFGLEGNPFLQPWVGEDNFLIMKLAGALFAVLILWDIHKQNPRLSFVSASCFVMLYTGIVLWNLFAFFIAQL